MVSSLISGRFRRILDLGRGGQARVSLAVLDGPQTFQKLVVLKELRPEWAKDPRHRENFRAEARLAARLNHPNVVSTLEVFEHLGHDFIVLEYLEGQTLNDIWAERRMPLVMSLAILRDVCAALHFTHELHDFEAHHLEIVHRDVSSHNVFVSYAGQVKLMDFGVAQWSERRGSETERVLRGKPAFMAPEQARGEPVDRRADIFSVGVLLFEALSGKNPWAGLSEARILSALRADQVPRWNQNLKDAGLGPIVRRALAPKPRDRYQTALELQSDLEVYLKEQTALLTQRELSAFVCSAFDSQRSARRRVLEEKLKTMQTKTAQMKTGNDPTTTHPIEPTRRLTRALPRGPQPIAQAHSSARVASSPGAPSALAPPRPGLGASLDGAEDSSPVPPPPSSGERPQSSLTGSLRLPQPYCLVAKFPNSKLVCRARNTRTGRDVAIKLLRIRSARELGARFSGLAQLRHPNTARIWEVAEIEGRPHLGFFAREFVAGVVLDDLRKVHGPVSGTRAFRLMTETLLSLAEAHERGIVHGRLYPEHVLVRDPGGQRESVKIIGYEGKISRSEVAHASDFQAPEQRSTSRPSICSDIFAVGALLHYLLWGTAPRNHKIMADQRSEGHELWQVSSLAEFLNRALSSDPLSRYQSAADALKGLALVDWEQVNAKLQIQPAPSEPRPRNPFLESTNKGRFALKVVRNELMSSRSVTIWVLDDDPAIRSASVQNELRGVSERYEVRHLGEADRELAIRQLATGEALPPWVIVFGHMSVLMDDPLLRTLGRCGELSRLLISSHEDFALLQNSINQSGLDHHLVQPFSEKGVDAAIEELVVRTRRLNNHYDEVRLALRSARDQVGELSRELAASAAAGSIRPAQAEAAKG